MPESFMIFVGVLDRAGSTNIPMSASFVKLGVQVIPVNYRTIISTQGTIFFEEYLLFLVKKLSIF